ncbi:methionyl-tRNA formyltransferase [Variovorax sp. PCZ-1]|uniref:methionyl-tRNA formyltransferase n=1 Tax=Variovorax sp. PCZ-1 TaxID=2835533 RepID=UPI001BCB7926|nr:methionyl-tRNA formyltransferase [Variovorax sp. PCZ-1]MBS7806452.1 methionyl-tRNA formyltransferase [Variovorax sp. PCZ-1]
MKMIFAGTPEFARVALQALHRAGHEIALVLTQPDRPAGRGMKLQASAVKQFALDHGIPVAQPRSLRLDGKYPEEALAAQAQMQATQADVMIVAAYGLILPQWVLDTPRLGCLNIHASLLPRWRGAAPIHRAIEAGDSETGITIMQMDAGLDTGDMLLVEKLPISPQDSTPSLHDKLAALGGRLIVQALQTMPLHRTAQPMAGITYAHKIDKAESAVNWQQSAEQIERRIRAFAPSPGCSAVLRGELIKLCAAQHIDVGSSEIDSTLRSTYAGEGTVLLINSNAIVVACGAGTAVRITELQRSGGKRLAAQDFLRGFPIQVGDKFESAKGD